MASGALITAIHHAHLVEQLEEVCPEVDPRSLGAAYRRMKLPIRVRFAPFNDGPRQWHMIVQRTDDGSYGRGFGVDDLDLAKAHYLNLCAQLLSPAAARPTPRDASLEEGGAPGADATVAASAPLSFESAARNVLADAAAVSPTTAAPAGTLTPLEVPATSSGARP